MTFAMQKTLRLYINSYTLCFYNHYVLHDIILCPIDKRMRRTLLLRRIRLGLLRLGRSFSTTAILGSISLPIRRRYQR